MDDGADDDSGSIGLSQQSNKEHTDNQQPSDKINENTVIFMNKVEEKKEQKSSKKEVSGNMDEGTDDRGSGGLSQQNNSEQTDKQQVSIMENEESDRSTLREEKEKRRKAGLLCEKNRVQLRKKEEHSIKEVEMNPQLETNIRTQAITLEIIGENEVNLSLGKISYF
ncbi:DNA ligase 1-like [Myotis daubentonii]|uniref:DNA ligase 1-like n=1 Tax=Myotis daubentonii TaxID=98922 RepID=UPI002872F98A|nr:DNA ligase 1-like [Myotis daubentonii]